MIFKVIDLKSESIDCAITEILFEIAGARADGCELVQVNLNDDYKLYVGITKHMKRMKQKGIIQFFATAESFSSGSTEASFLMNKYQDYIVKKGTEQSESPFIYIKL